VRPDTTCADGLTVADLARRWRVSEDKIRGWIRTGELRAVNTAASLAARPRWVVAPSAVADFEQQRSAATPRPTRRKRRQAGVDFYPDTPAEARG
jgi:Helix-turn-helix domain